ncbi:MAG: hypothetical protein IJL69_06290 [Oscillospiraceae bacterium]|nr:hypothetical protein [Oscillospiraceae bacterium]
MENNQYPQYTQPEYQPAPAPVSKKTGIVSMILGIASIGLCESVIGGLICAIIGLVLSKKAKAAGDTSTFPKMGKIFSVIGLILGIAACVVALILIIIAIAGGFAAASGSWR